MDLFHIHGLLQILIFTILYPIGALTALARNRIGLSWRKYHVAIQLVATILLFISVTIMHIALRRKKEPPTDSLKHHILIGRIVVATVLIQLAWAFLGRRFVSWNMWYSIHVLLSTIILLFGWYNIYVATRFHVQK